MLQVFTISEGLIHIVSLKIVVQWVSHAKAAMWMEPLGYNVMVLRVRADRTAWVPFSCSATSSIRFPPECKVISAVPGIMSTFRSEIKQNGNRQKPSPLKFLTLGRGGWERQPIQEHLLIYLTTRLICIAFDSYKGVWENQYRVAQRKSGLLVKNQGIRILDRQQGSLYPITWNQTLSEETTNESGLKTWAPHPIQNILSGLSSIILYTLYIYFTSYLKRHLMCVGISVSLITFCISQCLELWLVQSKYLICFTWVNEYSSQSGTQWIWDLPCKVEESA